MMLRRLGTVAVASALLLAGASAASAGVEHELYTSTWVDVQYGALDPAPEDPAVEAQAWTTTLTREGVTTRDYGGFLAIYMPLPDGSGSYSVSCTLVGNAPGNLTLPPGAFTIDTKMTRATMKAQFTCVDDLLQTTLPADVDLAWDFIGKLDHSAGPLNFLKQGVPMVGSHVGAIQWQAVMSGHVTYGGAPLVDVSAQDQAFGATTTDRYICGVANQECPY